MARDLRLFYAFRMLATSYLWVPIFVAFMRSRGLDWGHIMVLGAIYSAVVVFLEIPTGALADRLGRRTSMMMGALAMVASCLTAYFSHSFVAFAVAESFGAVSMSLCSGADSAYLFDLLHDNGRSDEYARHESTASAWHLAGNTVAFAAGGLIGEYVDLGLPYLITAGVSGSAFFVAVIMRGERRAITVRPRAPALTEVREYFALMRASLAEVRANRGLAWVIVYSGVVFILLKATVYLYQPFLKAHQFSLAETGFIFAGVYLVATFVAHRANAMRRAVGESPLVWGLLGGLGVSFLLLNQVRSEWAILLLVVQAVAMGLYSPLVKPLMNRQISASDRRATVLSIESIARRFLMVSLVFVPIAINYDETSALYWCGGVGLAGLGVLALFAGAAPMRRTELTASQAAARPLTEEAAVPPVTTLD